MSRLGPAKPALGGRWETISPQLSPWLLEAVRTMGFERMTPVQASTIPRAVKNQDCVVEAVTGSGKTLAFVLPVLERISRREQPFKRGQVAAMVIAPTRELAQQINEVFRSFLVPLQPATSSSEPVASTSRSPSPPPETPVFPLPCLVTSGTTNMYETFLSQSSNILVGTPGRLASFLLSPRGLSAIRVGDLDVLVLDEADRLLSNPDHRKDVQRIMNHLPKQRRTHLFSATMTDAVEEMIGLGLRNPVRIVVNLKNKGVGEEGLKDRRVPTALRNHFLVCRHAEKTLQAIRLLKREVSANKACRFIMYFATGAEVDYFYRIFSRLSTLSSFVFTSLYGDLPPKVRETALSAYTNHPASEHSPVVLLCTDVAARGVDFADIDVVIQYDPPTDPKTFSHRAGRTARAGRGGKAVCLLGEGKEEAYVDFLSARKIPLLPHGYINEALEETQLAAGVDSAATQLLDEIRQIALTDRDLADKAAKAFVSSLRAYTKHEAAFIFRLPELDLASMATAYGLLRMPAMPEVRDWRKRIEGEAEPPAVQWADAEVNWDSFAYASKAREDERLKALAARPAKPEFDVGEHQKKQRIKAEMREAWSDQKERKTRKEERRTKRDKRKQAEWEAKQAEGGEVGMVEAFKRKKRDEQEDDKEYKALKREMKEEKSAKRSRRDDRPADTGMFAGLD